MSNPTFQTPLEAEGGEGVSASRRWVDVRALPGRGALRALDMDGGWQPRLRATPCKYRASECSNVALLACVVVSSEWPDVGLNVNPLCPCRRAVGKAAYALLEAVSVHHRDGDNVAGVSDALAALHRVNGA